MSKNRTKKRSENQMGLAAAFGFLIVALWAAWLSGLFGVLGDFIGEFLR